MVEGSLQEQEILVCLQRELPAVAFVAQWIEHLTSDQTVGSSSLSGRTQLFAGSVVPDIPCHKIFSISLFTPRQRSLKEIVMARSRTGEARIWLTVGLIAIGLATGVPNNAAAQATPKRVSETTGSEVELVKRIATLSPQSITSIPVATQISPVGKPLANLQGTINDFLYDYLGVDSGGAMYWMAFNAIFKATPGGTISFVRQGGGIGDTIFPEYVDGSGNLYEIGYNCEIKKLAPSSSTPSLLTQSGCAMSSPSDGLASTKNLVHFSNLAFDTNGNIYFAEVVAGHGNKIRKIDVTTGMLSTVGGTGTTGDSGANGSQAVAAAIDVLGDIDVDGSGRIVFLQSTSDGATKVRQIDQSNGQVSVIATASTNAEFDQILAAPDGSTYVTEIADYLSTFQIKKIKTDGNVDFIGTGVEGYSGDGGSASTAKIGEASLMGVLPNNSLIFAQSVADFLPNVYDYLDGKDGVLRQVTSVGQISTISGLGDLSMNYQSSISLAVAGAHRIVTNSFMELEQGATESLSSVAWKYSILTQNSGTGGVEMYGSYGTGVGYVNASRSVSSTGVVTNASLSGVPINPDVIGYDGAGNGYYVPSGECRIVKRSVAGSETTFSGSSDCQTDTQNIQQDGTLAVRSDGVVYWSSPTWCIYFGACKIVKISADGHQEVIASTPASCANTPIDAVIDSGSSNSVCFVVQSMVVDKSGNIIFSDDYAGHLLKLSHDGQFSPLDNSDDYWNSRAASLALAPNGTLYFGGNGEIRKIFGLTAPVASILDALPETLQVPDDTPDPGQTISLTASGFDPFEWVVISLQSTPQVLTTVQADAQGDISVPVTIPANVESGSHTISALGTTSGNGYRAPLTIGSAFSIVALDSPKRLVDTRQSGGRFGSSSVSGVSVRRVRVAGATTVSGVATGLPSSGIGAVAMNVTVVDGVDAGGYGFVTVYPCSSVSTPVPDASNLNFAGHQTVPNSVLAPLSADGYVCFSIYGDAHLLVDVSGYVPAGSGLTALDSPKRLVDTRQSGGRFGSSSVSGVSVRRVRVAGATTVSGVATGLPSSGIGAVAMNVTVVDGVDAGGYGFVTVYPCSSVSTPVPDASNLNFAGHQTVPNSVLAPLSADGYVCFSIYGDAHLLVDVSAYA